MIGLRVVVVCLFPAIYLAMVVCYADDTSRLEEPRDALLRTSPACGPVALFAVGKCLGHEVNLNEITHVLGGREKRTHSLAELLDAAREIGLDASARRLTPNKLYAGLEARGYVCILAVRRKTDSIDHCVAALGAKDNKILVLDYPNLIRRWDMAELAHRWDGQAIVFRAQGQGLAAGTSFYNGGFASKAWIAMGCMFGILAMGLGLWSVVRWRQRARKNEALQ
jgi:ABC-type bacteriocin/lantibiotic exporter with double-glycine peptidase domain